VEPAEAAGEEETTMLFRRIPLGGLVHVDGTRRLVTSDG
jgi:hypothetical protein